MVYNEKNIIDIKTLKNLLEEFQRKVIIFGAGMRGSDIFRMLKREGVEVLFFVDNSPEKWGSEMNGLKIASPQKLLSSRDTIVVISCMYLTDVFEQLGKMDLENVYALKNIHTCYDFETALDEQNYLKKYFSNTAGKRTDKVLIKAFDGLGDTIIKIRLLQYLSQLDADRYYIITDRIANFEVYSRYFKHVLLIDRTKFMNDKTYRLEVLSKVNTKYFQYSVCYCANSYVHNGCDLLTDLNTNIPVNYSMFEAVKMKNGDSFDSIYNNIQIFAKKVFHVAENYNLDCKGSLAELICPSTTLNNIKEKYIAVGMGGVSWGHVFPAIKLANILKNFIAKKYSIVLLGHGDEDKRYYDDVLQNMSNQKCNVYNMCSKLTSFESINVINGADAFLGIDSALAHAAYALDKNSVILIGGNMFSEKYRHYDPKMIYLFEKMECYGCNPCRYSDNGVEDKKRGECISRVSEEKIISSLESLLND